MAAKKNLLAGEGGFTESLVRSDALWATFASTPVYHIWDGKFKGIMWNFVRTS
jgi:hypothetical protein